jgi:hypothetical protein
LAVAARPATGLKIEAMDESPLPCIGTRAEFAAALLWALQAAQARQSRRICLVDPDFADWPLGQTQVLAALQAWLRLPQRRLVLLAAHFTEMPRCHPRFVAWRRDRAHAIDAWSPPAELAALPRLLVDDGPVSLQLLDGPQWRGRASLDAREARRWRDEIDVVLQQCEPAFPVQTLGL